VNYGHDETGVWHFLDEAQEPNCYTPSKITKKSGDDPGLHSVCLSCIAIFAGWPRRRLPMPPLPLDTSTITRCR
jgi:hypothetical protein